MITLPESRTEKSVIKENMSQILIWVEQGYRIKAIYNALKKDDKIRGSFSNFTKYYYRFKNSGEVFSMSRDSTSKPEYTSEPSLQSESKPIHDQIASVEEEPVTAPKVNRALIQGFDFEENQRLARFAFKQAREQQ